jgi:antitoxin HigA-1
MITMHPGKYLSQVYFDALKISQKNFADRLNVSASAISRLLSCDADMSPEMAVRLSYVLDLSAEAWMEMQNQHSIAIAQKSLNRSEFVPIEINLI